jgi:hypothetical protein
MVDRCGCEALHPGILVALLLAASAQAGLAPKEKWWSQADLKVYMRIFP